MLLPLGEGLFPEGQHFSHFQPFIYESVFFFLKQKIAFYAPQAFLFTVSRIFFSTEKCLKLKIVIDYDITKLLEYKQIQIYTIFRMK